MSTNFTARFQALAADLNRGWQADLARQCQVSRTTVTHWLTGRSKGVESQHLFAVADYFQVNARWLAVGAGPQWADVPTRASDGQEVRPIAYTGRYLCGHIRFLAHGPVQAPHACSCARCLPRTGDLSPESCRVFCPVCDSRPGSVDAENLTMHK